MDCEVCVIGLGVSSIPLLKLLQQSGTDFRVVTSTAFGIWRKLADAGENFDLVTTIESTNYSWWESEFSRLVVCLCLFHLPTFIRLLLLILKPFRGLQQGLRLWLPLLHSSLLLRNSQFASGLVATAVVVSFSYVFFMEAQSSGCSRGSRLFI